MAKVGELKLINRAMIVKRCKITRDTLSNSFMVAKHTHRQLRVHKTLQDVRTSVRAFHCDNLDRIR